MTIRGIFKIWATVQVDNLMGFDLLGALGSQTWISDHPHVESEPQVTLTVVPSLTAAGFQLSVSLRGGDDVTTVVVFLPHLLMNGADGDGRRVRVCGGGGAHERGWRLTTCWCFPSPDAEVVKVFPPCSLTICSGLNVLRLLIGWSQLNRLVTFRGGDWWLVNFLLPVMVPPIPPLVSSWSVKIIEVVHPRGNFDNRLIASFFKKQTNKEKPI